MDYVKDKVNQASEAIQGKGSEAAAKQDKGELTANSFLVVRLTDSDSRGRQRQHQCRYRYQSHCRKGLPSRQEGPEGS